MSFAVCLADLLSDTILRLKLMWRSLSLLQLNTKYFDDCYIFRRLHNFASLKFENSYKWSQRNNVPNLIICHVYDGCNWRPHVALLISEVLKCYHSFGILILTFAQFP